MELVIYSREGNPKKKVSPDSSSRWSEEVASEFVVNVNFTTWEFFILSVGDYIEVGGKRFSVKKEYRPKKTNTQKYTYNISFYGREHDMQDLLFCRLNQGSDDLESVFAYDGTPMEYLQKLVDNMNRNTDGVTWRVGEAITASRQTINFNGLYCWDAAAEIAQAFETEWWLDGEYLNLSKCERGERVTLGYMKGLKTGLTQSENSDSVKWFTRLIPVGSTKNIDPSKYGFTHLQLPSRATHIDLNTQLGLKEHREERAFSDIFPHRLGTVSSVRSEEKTNENTGDYTVYYIKDNDLPFNPDDYMIGGEVIHITFESGDLEGREFECNWHNDTKEFEIINTYPDEDTQIPGGNLIPKAGDTYILTNIRMPDEYYPIAEQQFKQAVENYLSEYSRDISIYSSDTDYIYVDKHAVPLLLGQRVRLEDEQYFDAGYIDTRITRVERKLTNLSEASIDCSAAVSTSWKSSVNSSLDNLQYVLEKQTTQDNLRVLKTGASENPSDYNVFSALRTLLEISTRALSRRTEDTASGLITFVKGIISEAVSIFRKGARFGNFVTGMIGGSGGAVTVEEGTGKTILEVDKAIFREEMVTPKITFNCIDVISGDKANTFAFGTIRSVDTANRIIELDLLEDQTGTSKVNDICRGVFHSLSGGNNTSDSVDANGFLNYAGFATSYFTPSEILQNEPGLMRLRYTLQPGTTVHPMAGMNFYAYGNFTDPDRQAMTYETRYYTRRLKDVDTWAIDPTKNISMQDGLLEGLTIGGFVMHGYGTFQENTYLTGANIQFTPSQIEELQGKSAYSVSLSSYERVVKLDNQGNLTSLYEELNVISGNQNVISADENVVTCVYNLSTRIQAFKGDTELLFATAVDKDRYVVVVSATGCKASVSAGILTITEVTNYEECYVDLKINCEGNAIFDKRFSVVVVRNGIDGEGSITADVYDEMQSVACDASGAVTSSLPLTATFVMHYGTTQLALDSLSLASISGVTASANKDTGAVTVTAIAASASDTIRLRITGKATYNGTQYERSGIFSINKIKPGKNGENAVIYALQSSVNVIKRDSAGNSDVTNISCRILKTDGTSTVVSSRPSGYSLDYAIDSGTFRSYSPDTNISVSGITRKIQFRLYREVDTITMVDQETVYVVRDGEDGADGADGHSPYISDNGTWMVWDADQNMYVDSGDPAKGDDGHSPKIQNGTWWVWDAEQGSYADTGIKAKGEDGKDGKYTELRYRYSNGKPDKPSGLSPEGWFLSPDVKEPDLTHSGDFYLSDLYYTTGPSTTWNKTYIQRISFVATEPGQSFTIQVNCYTSRSIRYAVLMKLDTPYTSSYNSENTLWIGGGYQYTSIRVIAPSAGSHYIELAYAAASSSYAEGQMDYRIIPQKVCYLSSAVIDPNTTSLPAWSDPVEFPTDLPGEEQIYLLSKSEMTVEMPRSDSFVNEYIGDAYSYNAAQMYTKGDVVKYNGIYKVLIAASSSGISPDNAQYWQDTKWWTDNPSGVSEEYPYEYTCERKFDANSGYWSSYNNYRLFMNLAKDGQPAYQLVPSVSQIGRTSTGSYEPEIFTVSHKDAEGNAVDAYIGVYGSQDGGAWTKIGSVTKVSSVSVNVAQYPYKYFVIRTYEASSSSFDNYLLSTSVSVLSNGEKGDTGATGAMPVYCGFFSAGTEYTYTNTTRDIVNYEIDGDVFTFQVKRHGSAITVPPTSSTGDANWEPASKFKFVAMDTALIDGANIAGFMYKDLTMISRKGRLDGVDIDIKDVPENRFSDFVPNIMMNGNTGDAEFNKVKVRGSISEPFESYSSLDELRNGMSFSWIIKSKAALEDISFALTSDHYNGRTVRIYNDASDAADGIDFLMGMMGGSGYSTIHLPKGVLLSAVGIPVVIQGIDAVTGLPTTYNLTRWYLTCPYTYDSSNHKYTISNYRQY